METDIQMLRLKKTIVATQPQMDQFTSRLFVIPKKDGSLCPVINLRPLNWFIKNQHFKMSHMRINTRFFLLLHAIGSLHHGVER